MSEDNPRANTDPVGVFDSGVGGLSVLRQIRQHLPAESVIYLADQAHVPYGPRSHEEIYAFSAGITDFLWQQPVKAVVVACNRASAAALSRLRQAFPHIPFVGMEPAVKPAAQQTRTGHVGVLATQGTFNSERYATLMSRFAHGVTVWEDPCPGLVDLIEAGEIEAPQTEQFLRRVLGPMLGQGIDTLVLGCTHYPFLIPVIQRITGTAVTIIDPAPAVARQTERVLAQHDLLAPAGQAAQLRLLTTGPAVSFQQQVDRLLGVEAMVETAVWQGAPLSLLLSS